MLEPTRDNIQKHLHALVGERNPKTSLNRLQKTGRYIGDQFRSWNLEVQEEAVPFEGTQTMNMLGFQATPGAEGDAFVLAAHYDSVEGTPGADDNASAVAALLEIARCLAPATPNIPICFAAYTLEEYGFVGSRHHIQSAREKNGGFLGMISMEMVGFRRREPGSQTYPDYVDPRQYPDRGDFIAVIGNEPSAGLATSLAEAMRRTVPSLPVEMLILPGRGDQFVEATLSDHSPFWQNGIPAVMVTDTAFFRNPNYHQPTDTLETLDIEFIRDIAEGIAGFLEQYSPPS